MTPPDAQAASVVTDCHAAMQATPLPCLTTLPDISVGEIVAYVAVLRFGSFTEAAKRLYISQPGMSARIARLERALGVVLIDRSSRILSMTPAGEEFAETAAAMLRLIDAGRWVSRRSCPRRPSPSTSPQLVALHTSACTHAHGTDG